MPRKLLLPGCLLALFTLAACATAPRPDGAATPQTPAPTAPAIAPAPAPPLVDASAAAPKTGNARFFELHESFLARVVALAGLGLG